MSCRKAGAHVACLPVQKLFGAACTNRPRKKRKDCAVKHDEREADAEAELPFGLSQLKWVGRGKGGGIF